MYKRQIHAGEELNYDYGLIIDEPYTKKLLAEYPCWCGAKNCRGTLLSPKDREDTPKIPSQKKAKGKAKSKADTQPKVKAGAPKKAKANTKADSKDKKSADKAKKVSKKTHKKG